MTNHYNGTIVRESLNDQSILEKIRIVSYKTVGEAGDKWELVSVNVTMEEIANLKYYLKAGPWYANFWNNKETIIVFKDKIFTDTKSATEYGLSIGVPQEQLDFIQT